LDQLNTIYKKRAWLIRNFEALRSMMAHTNEFKDYYLGKEPTAILDMSKEVGRVTLK
jgi:hypothetical protein